MLTGGCLCGAVTFEADEIAKDYRACHCTACRKVSGHYWSASHVPSTAFRLTEDRGLRWFQSSDWAECGFCCECGSSLFFRMHDHDGVEVAPGAIDGPTGMTLTGHIYVEDKGDYYDLGDGLPQFGAGT
jgi:hypothetical protein